MDGFTARATRRYNAIVVSSPTVRLALACVTHGAGLERLRRALAAFAALTFTALAFALALTVVWPADGVAQRATPQRSAQRTGAARGPRAGARRAASAPSDPSQTASQATSEATPAAPPSHALEEPAAAPPSAEPQTSGPSHAETVATVPPTETSTTAATSDAAPATAYEEPDEERELAAREAEDARGEDVVASITDVIGQETLTEATAPNRPHRVPWNPAWPRYSFDEAVLTVGLVALLTAAELLPNSSFEPNWRGVLFDDAVRDGLRLDSYDQREQARVAGDVLMWVNIGIPFLVDAFGAMGIADGNWDSALQMGLISLESYVVTLVVWRVTAMLSRRERPVETACVAGDTSPHCSDRYATQSFFSAQTANAFTGAALTCLHHSSMPVFGDVGWDGTACVSSTLVATAVGLLRVMSDFEYLTDVLTGAAVGWLSGYVLPWLLHYQGGARPELRAPIALVPAPMVGNGTYGMTVAGWF